MLYLEYSDVFLFPWDWETWMKWLLKSLFKCQLHLLGDLEKLTSLFNSIVFLPKAFMSF